MIKKILLAIIIIALIGLGYWFFYFDFNKGLLELNLINSKYGLSENTLPDSKEQILAFVQDLQNLQDKTSAIQTSDAKTFTLLVKQKKELALLELNRIEVKEILNQVKVIDCTNQSLIENAATELLSNQGKLDELANEANLIEARGVKADLFENAQAITNEFVFFRNKALELQELTRYC